MQDPGEEAASNRRDAELSRELILDAAETLFAEKGYEGTSLKEIGETVGLSRGTPGYFFRSKQGLYAAVKERLARHVRDFAQQTRSTKYLSDSAYLSDPIFERKGSGAPREVIAAAIRAYIDFLASRPTYVRFIEREAAGEDDFLKYSSETSEEATHLAGSLAEFGNRFLEQELAREEHPVLEDEVRRLSASMCAVCCFPFLLGGGLFTTFGLDPHVSDFTEAHKEHAVQFIMRGLYG